MKTTPLGNTGEEVSALCLGAMYFGSRQNQAESFQLLDQYYEAGGTFIDTANIYAWWVKNYKGGESETILGKWIKERNNRQKVFIASKVGFNYQDVPTTLSAKIIQQECNKSLKRLGVETIDLYYAHKDDRLTPLDESLEAFSNLIDSGKIRYIGASNYTSWRIEEARLHSLMSELPEYCCIQQRHSYIRPKHGTSFEPQVAVNEDLLDYVKNRKITLLAYSVLLSGAYARHDRDFDQSYLGTDTDNRLSVLKAVSTESGASINQVILAWMLQNDPQVLPLIAASTPEQMSENINSLKVNLSQNQIDRLNQAGP